MNKKNRIPEALVRQYFKENSFVKADIDSFNNFIENGLQKIIDANKEIEPTIIPSNIDEFKIKLDKIWVTKPEITEADGSKRIITPMEARIRQLTYAAPIFIEVSAHINGIQRESFTTQVGNMPIMLKSNNCHLAGLSKKELIEKGEDPEDPGGYFIINGTEKVIIKIEDLAPNRFNVNKASVGISEYVGSIFSERGSYKIPHKMEKLRDGILYLTFTRVKRVPVILLIKALGLIKDEEIVKAMGLEDNAEVLINLMEFAHITDREEALYQIAKHIGINQTREILIERVRDILIKYLLPHIGNTEEACRQKALNLCKMFAKFIRVSNNMLPEDDKDHYRNKRLKFSGDLLADLFEANLRVLINDMLYNFQRIVKRGKFPSIKVIIREKLLTQMIYSSMATGSWIGGRTGVSQRMDRLNRIATYSHLQRVISPLSSAQENFEARALHSTHLGRLCPTESPEGTNIGLRKNLALMANASLSVDEDKLLKELKLAGLEAVK